MTQRKVWGHLHFFIHIPQVHETFPKKYAALILGTIQTDFIILSLNLKKKKSETSR